MRKLISIFGLIVFINFISIAYGKIPNSISTKQFNKALENITIDHPRMFLQEKNVNRIRNRIEENNLIGKAFENLQKYGEKTLSVNIPRQVKVAKLPTTGFREITSLALLYRITKKDKYLKKAKQTMLAIANWQSWYPRSYINTASTTAALGIGYDWLYNELSENERQKIKNAIIEKGFKPSFNGQWWVYCNHNWNSACHGRITMAAIALLKEDNSDMAEKVLRRALNALPILLKEYAPDGAYHEGGPGYSSIGTGNSVKMIAALESALGTDFGFKSYKGFMNTARYRLHSKVPSGDYYFSSGDSDSGIDKELGYGFFPEIFWFADKLDDPTLLWHQKPMFEKLVQKGKYISPFFFIYQKGNLSRQKPHNLNWVGRGRTPVSFHRTGWNENATFVGIKGGSPGTNHAHMDIGSFVIDAMGEPWAMDLGSERQTKIEPSGLDIWNMNQTSDRWKVFRNNNRSHNTLVIDGKLQRVPGQGRIVKHSSDYDFSYTILDMHKVYQGLLGNNPSVRRGIGLYKDGSIIIQDEIKGKAKRVGSVDWGMNVRWGMVTPAEVEIVDAKTAILKQNDKEMWFHLLSPQNSEIEIYNTEDPPHEYDTKNEGTRMVIFNTTIESPGEINRLTVYLHPKYKAKQLPEIKPLYEW